MTKLSVESFIDQQKVSSFQRLTSFLCFLVVAIDGFDTAAVGYVAPVLSKDWGITPARRKAGSYISDMAVNRSSTNVHFRNCNT